MLTTLFTFALLGIAFWLAVKNWHYVLVGILATVAWGSFWAAIDKYTSSSYTIYNSGVAYTCTNDKYGRDCYDKDGIGLGDDEYWKRRARIRKAEGKAP